MKTRNGLFADVPENLWNDWHWQVANRAETVEDLKKYMTLTPDEEEGVRKTLGKLRMAVTPYYLSLIDLNDPFDPIRKMAIPRAEELEYADYEDADPLHEDTDSPTPGLTHRYPDRVLLLITDQCSMYCRHCTRRRFAGQNDCEVPMAQIDKCIDYVAAHPEVRDVLLSGGDCLMVSDENLEYIIKRLRAIPHVEIVRLGSRTPVVCPQRITPELCAMLRKYHPIWLNTHFNTPKEFTDEAAKACAMLADAGIPLGNQSVLLAGVNDCSHVMMELVHGLDMADRPFDAISDGQRQRVLLARALCQQPELIVLDEPTSFLDIRYKLELLTILKRMVREEHLAVLMSLHELDLAARVSDTVVCVAGDRIDRVGPPSEIFTPDYIAALYRMEPGKYDPCFDSLEFVPGGAR